MAFTTRSPTGMLLKGGGRAVSMHFGPNCPSRQIDISPEYSTVAALFQNIWIYIYIEVCTTVYTHIHIQLYIYHCIHIHRYICTYTTIQLHTHVHMYIYNYIYTDTYTIIHIQVYIHIHIWPVMACTSHEVCVRFQFSGIHFRLRLNRNCDFWDTHSISCLCLFVVFHVHAGDHGQVTRSRSLSRSRSRSSSRMQSHS